MWNWEVFKLQRKYFIFLLKCTKIIKKLSLLTIFIIAQSSDISDNELPQQALRSGAGASKKLQLSFFEVKQFKVTPPFRKPIKKGYFLKKSFYCIN